MENRENPAAPQEKLDRHNVKVHRISLEAHFCPLRGTDPIVVELPGVSGFYVPVFKTKDAMADGMRYIGVHKYATMLISSTVEFMNFAQANGVKIVVNPKAYNGRCVWEHLLPHKDGVISLPGEGP